MTDPTLLATNGIFSDEDIQRGIIELEVLDNGNENGRPQRAISGIYSPRTSLFVFGTDLNRDLNDVIHIIILRFK